MTRVLLSVPNLALQIGLRSLLEEQLLVVINDVFHDEEKDLEYEVDIILAAMLESDVLAARIAFGKPLLLLTDDPDDVDLLANAALPGWGVLPINCTEDELFSALRAIEEGLLVGSPALLRTGFQTQRIVAAANEDRQIEPLTAREMEVLHAIAQGLANKQIALALSISEHTVKFHLSSIYAKLEVSSRTEAVNVAMRRGMIIL